MAARGGPGTTIYVKPGVYREQVTIGASGAPGNPLVIQALGGPVFVDGADDFSAPSNWVLYAGDVYLATGVTWSPAQVFMDGERLVASSDPPVSLGNQAFTWVPGQGLYLNAGGGSPALHQLLVGRRPYGFLATGRSYITIDGFVVTRAENRCLQFNTGCTNIVVSHNVVSYALRYGIQVVGGSAFVIGSNDVSDNDDHGIMLLSGVTGSTIQDNESFRNARPSERAANGIHLFGCPGNRVQNNRTHDNQDSGIQIDSGSNDCVLIQNRSWNNGDHGFDNISSTGIQHVGDVAFGNVSDGFAIQGDATGTTLVDCIAQDNGLATSAFDLSVDPTSAAGFESDYNIFWNSTSRSPVKYAGTQYPTIAGYSAATGEDAHSIQADADFMNPWTGNLHVIAGSPAIDAANSGVANWPATDAEEYARVDDPSTPNTGVGPVPYADLGALEFLDNGVVIRPVAALAVTPSLGTEPLDVTVDASGSSDPDGTIVSYWFDFGDGSTAGPQSSPTMVHAYAAGSWLATVVVADNVGAAGVARAPVVVAASSNGNLVGNPSFEQNLDGWNAFDGCTLTRVPGGNDGNDAAKLTATGPGKNSFGLNDHPDWVRDVALPGLKYRFTAWVRSAGSVGTAKITVREYLLTNGQLVGSAISAGVTLSPDWQMVTLDYVTNSPGSTLDFQIRDYPVAVGESFFADNISITLLAPVSSADGPAAPVTLEPRVYPSPFRSEATLLFATSRPGPLRADVFDLAGRRVRRLADDRSVPAGVHRLTITATGGAEPLDPGIYFYRIEALEGVRTGRFVILR